jgi:hypothetical protein
MVNGPRASSMAMEFGRATMETSISGSGIKTKHTDTAFTSGKMVTDMRASGSSV